MGTKKKKAVFLLSVAIVVVFFVVPPRFLISFEMKTSLFKKQENFKSCWQFKQKKKVR